MFARIAVWEPMPDNERQWVIDAAKTVPGVMGAYHLVDPATGNGISILFFEDDRDVAQVKAAIADKALEIGWNDVPRPTHLPGPTERLSRVRSSEDAGATYTPADGECRDGLPAARSRVRLTRGSRMRDAQLAISFA